MTRGATSPCDVNSEKLATDYRYSAPVFVGLFLLFLILYLKLGFSLAKTRLLGLEDVYFEADTVRVIRCITDPGADYTRTDVHPLFVILFHPLSRLLGFFIKEKPMNAAALNAVIAALQIPFFQLLLRRAGVSALRSVAFAILLGATATHVAFGVVPETYAASGLGLILFALALCSGLRRAYLVLAGTFAFGSLITNIVPVLLLFAFMIESPSLFDRAKKIFRFGLEIALLATPLSILQRLIWPTTTIFFTVLGGGETAYMNKQYALLSLGRRALLIFKHFILWNITLPQLDFSKLRGDHMPVVSTMRDVAMSYSSAGFAAALLWSVLVAVFLRVRFLHHGRAHKLLLGSGAYLAYLFVFHLFYGDELFLYSQTWTFAVLGAVCLGLRALKGPCWDLGIAGIAGGVALFTLVNSLAFVQALSAAFAR